MLKTIVAVFTTEIALILELKIVACAKLSCDTSGMICMCLHFLCLALVVSLCFAFVLSNVRGPSEKIHWNGREIVSMGGFVPLPPGMFVGVGLQSYNGTVSITINADRRIVPDADLFLKWVLEEYTLLCQRAEKKRLENVKD